ncbi:translation initiation factor IF-2-like [Meles meles]|uniref:translation initiation factor IF-2-like n=1 Tax=Meles meles TaxID=9662 RepID=UPI001E69AC81|nr:translation initiation factor IF-2-like [Meles meles]
MPPPPPPRAPSAARSFSLGGAGTEEPRGEKARRRRTRAERARAQSPAGKFRGRPRLAKFLWAARERDPGCGLRERVVRRLGAPPPPPRRLCATPLGQAWESARPPPHLLKAPGAESPPAPQPHVSRPLPRPRAPPRARPPGPRPLGLARPHLGRRGPYASRGPGAAAPFPPGRAAEGREPEKGVGLGVLLGATGAANLQQGTEEPWRERTSRQLSGGAQGEDRPLWPSDFPLFPERRRGGRRGLVGPALAAASLSAPPAPRAPRGYPASEPGRPALVLGIRPRPRTARGP